MYISKGLKMRKVKTKPITKMLCSRAELKHCNCKWCGNKIQEGASLQEFCMLVEKVQGRPWPWTASTGCVDLPRVQTTRWASAASPFTVPQCGTVCHQRCVTAACHWTRFSGSWRLNLFGQSWMPPGAVVAFLCDSVARYKCNDLLTYLCVVTSKNARQLFLYFNK